MDNEMLQRIISSVVANVLAKINFGSLASVHPKPFPIGVSNRHIHLSGRDLELLFGEGYSIKCERGLSQPGQFAAVETVIIAGPKGCIEQVRILGPVRNQTQVEVTASDAYRLGINAPLRESGNLEGSSGLTVIGPAGSLHLKEGAIIVQRHIHMAPNDAHEYGVADGQAVQVKVGGGRGMIYDNVLVRVSDKFVLEFHIDIDEANAAGIRQGDSAHLIMPVNYVSDNIAYSNKGIAIPDKAEGFNAKLEYDPARTIEEPRMLVTIEKPRTLVTEETVRQASRKKAVLVINKGVICTPLARDAIKEADIEVIWK